MREPETTKVPLSRTSRANGSLPRPPLERARLAAKVSKYQKTSWRAPLRKHNIAAFDRFMEWLEGVGLPLVLDSGCGTGRSTAALGDRFSHHAVVGVDRSAMRLSKSPAADGCSSRRLLWLRADLQDFWRLLATHGPRVDHHLIAYPNPYPKPGQWMRRWYGHPTVVLLPRLSRSMEVRSNLLWYLEDFQYVLNLLGARNSRIDPVGQQPAISRFEDKYRSRGDVFQLRANF